MCTCGAHVHMYRYFSAYLVKKNRGY
jgi:hypothetical protein